jgi:hypothetical protein
MVCIRCLIGIHSTAHGVHPIPHWYAFYSTWCASGTSFVCILQLMVCILYLIGMHSTAHGVHPIHHSCAFYSSWCASYTSLVYILQLVDTPYRRHNGSRREMHSEKLPNVHSKPNTIRLFKWKGMIWAGHVTRGEERNGHKILVWEYVHKVPPRTPRHRLDDNIKIDLG